MQGSDPLVTLTHCYGAMPPPHTEIVKSAPATCPATRRHSALIKWKACSIPLGLHPGRGGSIGKRRRLASQVHRLLQEELRGRWYTYGNFLADFVFHGPWALGDAQALDFLALLSRDKVTTGIADAQLPAWFCGLANTILRVSQGDTGTLGNICTMVSTVGGCLPLTDITSNERKSQRPEEHTQGSPPP